MVRYPAQLLLLASVLSVAGCSLMEVSEYQDNADQLLTEIPEWDAEQASAEKVSLLTDLIDLPHLKALIDQGLKANPGLQQTVIALKVAQRRVGEQEGDRLPQANLTVDSRKTETSAVQYSANATVSWTLDIWQSIGDSISAAEADRDGAVAQLQGARDMLAADIISQWLSLISQQQLIEIQRQRTDALIKNAELTIERYRNGLGELNELDTARSNSASAKSELVSLENTYDQSVRNLKLLLGGNEAELPESGRFPDVLMPLAELPEQTLARRPDLQQAYSAIVAAQFEASVAYKSLLPGLSLQAAITDSGGNIGEALFSSSAWSLLGQLTAPLFRGGQLKARVDIAELTAEQAYWAYQETLLNAVNETENALANEGSLRKQEEHLTVALENAERSFISYSEQYRQGLINLLDLLQVQQQTFDLRSQLIQITHQRYRNRITLGLALGLGVSA